MFLTPWLSCASTTNVAVGHKGIEAICERLTVARACRHWGGTHSDDLLVNRCEKFARHRYGDRFNANDPLDLVRRHSGFRSLSPVSSRRG